MRRICLALNFALLSSPVLAHPHMFLDTAINVMFNDAGHAKALRITWVYDDLSSLQLIADRGLDPDGDGQLTPAEKTSLSQLEMNWDANFPGDTYVLLSGQALALLPPRDGVADYVEGKIISTFTRDLAAPAPLAPGQELIVQVYDPSFYIAYTMKSAALSYAATARACAAQLDVPDRSAADQALLAALAEYGADEDIEADFPAIGAAFAEEVRVTCGG